MKKGFSITCMECNEEMILSEGYKSENDNSKITSTIMGSYPFNTLFLVCSNCGNEIEVEV